MKTRTIVTGAILVTALTIGAIGISFAAPAEQSCCNYMQTNVCAQYMQVLTPQQRLDVDGYLQKKEAPAEGAYYPGGVKYLPGAY